MGLLYKWLETSSKDTGELDFTRFDSSYIQPSGVFFVSAEYFILGMQYFLRTENLALGEVFFVIIYAPVVLGSPCTKIRIFFPSALFNLQKLTWIKYAHIRETGT